MNPFTPSLVSTFREWLITPTLQASVLVLVVLAVQWLFQKQLRPRWRYALWWVVLLKLMLPWAPESSVSLFNWVKPTVVRLAAGEVSLGSNRSVPPVSTLGRLGLDRSSAVSDPAPATLPPLLHSPSERAARAPSALQRVEVAAPFSEIQRSSWNWISLLMVLWGGGGGAARRPGSDSVDSVQHRASTKRWRGELGVDQPIQTVSVEVWRQSTRRID